MENFKEKIQKNIKIIAIILIIIVIATAGYFAYTFYTSSEFDKNIKEAYAYNEIYGDKANSFDKMWEGTDYIYINNANNISNTKESITLLKEMNQTIDSELLH